MTTECAIGDLIEALIDYRGKTPPKSDAGVPLITAKVIKGGMILDEPREYIAEDIYESWMRRGMPKTGDILITTEAPLGEVAQVGDDARIALAQRVILLRADRSKVDQQFLFHYLRSPAARASLMRRSSGTTVSGIRQPELRAVEVPLLDRPAQERVGWVLDAIDNLIENNRRRVGALDEMVRSIYREWFVHFRYPGNDGAIFVDSSIGDVPDGWSVVPLFEAADVGFGFSFKSAGFSDLGPYPVIRIRDVLAGITRTFSDEEPEERYRVRDGDVLIGMDGDFHLRQWRGGDAWLNQRVARLRPKNGMSALHLMLGIGQQIVEWNSAIVGTTVAHLGRRHLEQVRVVVPPEGLLAQVTEFFDDASRQACALDQAIRQLAAMRDLLLPKLVTGQIDVSSLDLDALDEDSVA